MNAQHQFEAALTMIGVVVKAYANTPECKAYWNGLLSEASNKTLKIGAVGGAVQATISDPLAYWAVPIYGWNMYNAGLTARPPRGRSMEIALGQLVRVMKLGLTTRADKVARVSSDLSLEEMMVAKTLAKDGMAVAFLKNSSKNKDVRQSITDDSLMARLNKAAPVTKPATKPAGLKLIE